MVTLTDQERRALNEFIASNYSEFLAVAGNFLDQEETEELEAKLSEGR